MGAGGVESVTVASGTIGSINSNLFFTEVSGGNAMVGFQGPNDASASPTSVSYLGNNLCVNCSSYVQQYSGNSFIQTLGTDTNLGVKTPLFIEGTRSVSLFDVEYLDPAGLLSVSSYSASAWVTGHSYNVGDVVSFQNGSAFGNKTTYWRCIAAHTSGSTNEPLIGNDSSNPWQGPAGFWEEAFWQWVRLRVLDNSTYDAQCAALVFVPCGSPHTYIGGLLTAWVRDGFVSLDPATTKACSPDRGTTKVDCGAIPVPTNQRIVPVIM
jgi:hypothetical protein